MTEPYAEKRRSPRIMWRIPFVVTWTPQAPVTVREQGETEVVNAHGALIKLSTPVRLGQKLKILRPGSPLMQVAHVVSNLGEDAEGRVSLGVELDHPNSDFWVELAR